MKELLRTKTAYRRHSRRICRAVVVGEVHFFLRWTAIRVRGVVRQTLHLSEASRWVWSSITKRNYNVDVRRDAPIES